MRADVTDTAWQPARQHPNDLLAGSDDNDRQSRQAANETEEVPALGIPLEKACRVILKAREIDVKDAATKADSGSNPADDHTISVPKERADDPVGEERRCLLSALSQDEQIKLVALT
jgi:hypothetical protein